MPKRPQVSTLTACTVSVTGEHQEHTTHPHDHQRMADGTVKECSQRYWCVTCALWYTGKAC
jgi:hypothetical protein